jgi:hypothetical protein
MATVPLQSDPVEGPRKDEQTAEKQRRSRGHHSSDEPAEGADGLPAGDSDSPQ